MGRNLPAKRWWGRLVLGAALMLLGCRKSDHPDAGSAQEGASTGVGGETPTAHPWTTQDTWYRPKPQNLTGGVVLAAETISPVAAAQVSDAVTQLSDASWVAVSPAQAEALCGKPMTAPHLYLVRAVVLYEEAGNFLVFSFPNGALEILHLSVGHSAVPMQRHPVVVELEKAPTDVYAACGMVE